MFKLALLTGALSALHSVQAKESSHTRDPAEKEKLYKSEFSSLMKSCDKKGQDFLDEKIKDKNVFLDKKTGLMFKVLKRGEGKEHPLVGTECECNYEGTLVTGKKFDSSFDRGQPLKFAPNQVIKGWTIAMQEMVEGDYWELYIPADLGYGAQGAGGAIPGKQALVFKMRMEKIMSKGKGKTLDVNDELVHRVERDEL